MASTYSPNLRIELIATGEQANTWGTTTNTNLGTLIEQAISGLASVDVTAGDVTLTALDGATDQSRQMIIVATGTPGVTRTITAPAVDKVYVVHNNSDASISFIASGGTGVTLIVGAKKYIYCDGTNFYETINALTITSGTINNTTIGATTPTTGKFTTVQSTVATGTAPFIVASTTVVANLTAANVTTNANLTGAVTSVGNATSLGSFTSAQLATALTDETGTGANVFADNASLLNPTYTGTLTGGTGVVAIGTNQIYKDASGNVGIGTASPNNKLTVGAPNTNGGSICVASFSGANVVNLNTSGMVVITPTDSIAADIGGSIGFAANGTIMYPTGSIAGRRENATANNYASYMQFSTCNSGGTVSEKMRIDSVGNVGIGVTPSASTTFPALEIGGGNCIFGSANSFVDYTYNAYYNGAYRYKTTGYASYYEQAGGSHRWFNAPAGTAGNAIGFTQSMTLDSSGNVGIGTSSPSTQLHIASATAKTRIDTTAAASNNPELQLSAVARQFNIGVGGATFATPALQGSYYIYDNTAATYRMVIDYAGNVGIGLTSPTGKLDVAGTIKTLGYTVASLPTGVVGARAYVTDALAPTFGAIVVTGGAITIPVFYNGTNWIVG